MNLAPLPRRAALLLLLALPACNFGTEPVSLNVQFVGNHQLNPDGGCTVQFVAQAFGFGSLHWERVSIRSGDRVVEEWRGQETAQFWGAAQISAGQTQLSEPFDAPQAARDTRVELQYRVGDSNKTATLTPICTD